VTGVWATLALVALAGAVVVRRRRDLPRRRLVLSLLWTVGLLSAVVALQGVVVLTTGAVLLVWGLSLAARRGLREPGGRFTGRGVAVLLLLVSGGLLLAFGVGAALDTGSVGRHVPSDDPQRGLELP
jgi:amino acid transporter